MSEITEVAWTPFGQTVKFHSGGPKLILESSDEFIGPRTTGSYQTDGLCETCMQGFIANVAVMKLQEMFRSKYCPACVAKMEAEEDAARPKPKTRAEKWAGICPAAYLKTDLERLNKESKLSPMAPVKMPCREFIQDVLSRPYSNRGLGFTGDVRLGKTRLMFLLLGKYYLDGRRVLYTYAPDFSDTYAGLMSDSAAKGDAYLRSCIEAEVWFLDDLGKGRLSEAAQRALLRVVEKRTNQERPIFVTCNDDGETLIARMRYEDTGGESEYARPMIERLREFCDFRQF